MRRDPGLFFELAQCRRPRLLALVDPALRHLPGFVGIIDPPADKHHAIAVEEHDADPAAVEMIIGHRARSTIGLRYSTQCARSSFAEGTALRQLRKPWIVP